MRLAWYAGASTALAAGVIVSAFHQRANFYSAMVYLSQSNLCLMILINLIFLMYGSFMYGLQRVCFGQLRPVEIEQLYEKAWFAVTETCLAMTIFRDQVGGFFLVMFTALVTGKVWGWIGEGRVEVLEQQPPANPRLFHTRLSVSLALSLLYDSWLLHYAVTTVIQQARPDMMVMFLFEYAILTVCSFHTSLRYIVSLVDSRIVQVQTRNRLEERRRQVREEREAIVRRREAGEAEANNEELPNENDVEEMDIEVPGWETKGQWVLSLDLCADFLKLCIYATFFFVILTFYGLPIHIMRDLFMTTRSFIKQLGALLRYRQALRDMNKYPDASEEELAQENTCIVCREEMHVWDANDTAQIERHRPKKLPCGHILHFGCLKSWLERQQVCPTCRRSVVMTDGPPARNREAVVFRVGLNLPGGGGNQNQNGAPANGPAPGGDGAGGNAQPPQGNGANGVRMFNFGPLRLGFAHGGIGDIPNLAQRLGAPADMANLPAAPGQNTPPATSETTGGALSSDALFSQLREIEQRIQRESQTLRFAEQEAQLLRILLTELQRIRQAQSLATAAPGGAAPTIPAAAVQTPFGPPQTSPLPAWPPPNMHQAPTGFGGFAPRVNSSSVLRLGADPNTPPIPAGSADLPEGVTLPPGWTLMPLQRLDGNAAGLAGPSRGNTPAPVPELHAALHQHLHNHMQSGLSQLNPAAAFAGGSTSASNPDTTGTVAGGGAGPDSGTGTSVAAVSSREPAPVVQPTPVAPNWGGSAQPFSNASFLPLAPAPGRMTAVQPGEPGSSSQASMPPSSPSASGAAAAETSREAQNGSTDKGKARAVTVEETEDEDAGH